MLPSLYLSLAGLSAELYYVRDGVVNEYALHFNVPVAANVRDIAFTWQSLAGRPVTPTFICLILLLFCVCLKSRMKLISRGNKYNINLIKTNDRWPLWSYRHTWRGCVAVRMLHAYRTRIQFKMLMSLRNKLSSEHSQQRRMQLSRRRKK